MAGAGAGGWGGRWGKQPIITDTRRWSWLAKSLRLSHVSLPPWLAGWLADWLADCVWLFWNYNIIAVSTSRWSLTNTRLPQAWPPLTTSYSAELRKFIVIFLSTSPHCSVSCLDIFTSHIYSDLLNLSALRWQAGRALSKYENFMFLENQIRWAACRSTALPHSRLFFSLRQRSTSKVRAS